MQCHVRARIWDMTVRGHEHRAVIVDREKDDDDNDDDGDDDDDDDDEEKEEKGDPIADRR